MFLAREANEDNVRVFVAETRTGCAARKAEAI